MQARKIGERRLTETAVRWIREDYAKNASLRGLAARWNVSRSTIQKIVHGRSYKDVSGPRSDPRCCQHCGQIIPVAKP